MKDMGTMLIFLGIAIVIAGVALNAFGKFGLPRLPGDIFYQKDNVTVYFPIVTSIVVSIIITIILNLFRK